MRKVSLPLGLALLAGSACVGWLVGYYFGHTAGYGDGLDSTP